jgi:hypothetical protein
MFNADTRETISRRKINIWDRFLGGGGNIEKVK